MSLNLERLQLFKNWISKLPNSAFFRWIIYRRIQIAGNLFTAMEPKQKVVFKKNYANRWTHNNGITILCANINLSTPVSEVDAATLEFELFRFKAVPNSGYSLKSKPEWQTV